MKRPLFSGLRPGLRHEVTPARAKATPSTGPGWPARTTRSTGLIPAKSHSRKLLSSPAVANVLQSGENAASFTGPQFPFGTKRSAPLATSHSRTVPSSQPSANVLPSGKNAAAVPSTPNPKATCDWGGGSRHSFRFASFNGHNRSVLSSSRQASVAPSGAKATARGTVFALKSRTGSGALPLTSHSRVIRRLGTAAAKVLPSGEKATGNSEPSNRIGASFSVIKFQSRTEPAAPPQKSASQRPSGDRIASMPLSLPPGKTSAAAWAGRGLHPRGSPCPCWARPGNFRPSPVKDRQPT